MHEAGIANGILQAILAEAKKQKGKPVSATVSCGVFNTINDELMNFAFEVIAHDTPCKDLKLKVVHKPLKAKCKSCKKTYNFDMAKPNCTHCGGDDFEMQPDSPLLLEEVQFETE